MFDVFDALDTFSDFILARPWQALGVVMLGLLAASITMAAIERRWAGRTRLDQQHQSDRDL